MDFSQLNWFDYCAIVIIALSSLLGIKRGLLREVISLLTWITAFAISIIFSHDLATLYISQYIQSETVSVTISFSLLFICTLVIGALINYIVTSFVERTGIMWGNYLLGAVFGFIRGIVITLVVVLLLVNTDFREKDWFKKALIPDLFEQTINWIQPYITPKVEKQMDEVKEEIEQTSSDIEKKVLEKLDDDESQKENEKTKDTL